MQDLVGKAERIRITRNDLGRCIAWHRIGTRIRRERSRMMLVGPWH